MFSTASNNKKKSRDWQERGGKNHPAHYEPGRDPEETGSMENSPRYPLDQII